MQSRIERVGDLLEMIGVRRDDQYCVHFHFRDHVAIVGKRRRLLLDWVKNLALITVEIFLVRIAQRYNLGVLHLLRKHVRVQTAHAAATNHSQSYSFHTVASLANELAPGKPSSNDARGQ